MNKQALKDQLIHRVQNEIAELEQVCQSSQSLVQGGDLKSDGKYDTRATEAGYLAGAQNKRLEELKLELTMLTEIPVVDYKDQISIGDLITMEHNGQKRLYYLTPTGGGSMLVLEGEAVMVITVFSPLGSEVLGLSQDDNFEIELKGQPREYKVVKVV